jgi:7-cyano-7-deazaguanine tRNA-ribosyltransferase
MESRSGGRKGVIRFGKSGSLETPALFPAMCIMTGPPGFGRQGAHYKYIKRIMCLNPNWGQNHFLSEILHFSDYMHTPQSLGRWLERPFQDWMDEMVCQKGDQGEDFEAWLECIRERTGVGPIAKPYEACFFLDSGGYKLLSNSDFSIEKFGYATSPESILALQKKMGADIVASLDYPLADVEYKGTALADLQEKSLRNAIWLYRTLAESTDPDFQPLAYLAVHGVDYETTKHYTEDLLARIDGCGVSYPSFGFAIGSLVPRRSNRGLVASIVKGVIDAIREYADGKYAGKPVHAFGMAGDILPTLVMLGVDTFDSNSFVQGGKNLRYTMASPERTEFTNRSARSLRELSANDLEACGCRACSEYRNFLVPFQQLSHKARDDRHVLEGVTRPLIKSEIYAFLALHNLEMEYRELEVLKHQLECHTLRDYVLRYAEHSNTRGALVRAFEAATGSIVEREAKREVSLNLGRDSFSVPESYTPSHEKEILLFLPCTKDKPYKNARSHQAIVSALHRDSRIHIVTVSGLYGPVPEELEESPEVMQYDYVLSPEAGEQMKFVQERLVAYLTKYGNAYRGVFGYATSRAYRTVLERAFRKAESGVILPTNPAERTTKEFLRYENIQELQMTLGPFLTGATFADIQLTMII